MKTVKITIILALINLTINAQTQLWSMSQLGGAHGEGNIFNINFDGSGYTSKFDFNNTDGSFGEGSLIWATNGILYGMANQGGTYGDGVLFSFDPITNTYTTFINFNGATNGQYPYGSLLQANNGKLYGMTTLGGLNNFGVLFSYDISLNTFTKLHDFDSINGYGPNASLIQDSNGKLYGTTGRGGINNFGVIFSYGILSNTYNNIHNFDSLHGSVPQGSLFQDTSNSKLYGTTKIGGVNDDGVIFSIDTNNNFSVLYNFNGTSGKLPVGNLISNPSSGKLYGLTPSGGLNNDGVLFSFDIITNTYSNLLDFNGSANGAKPSGSLFRASNGKLYGMTNIGGINNQGAIFEYNPMDSTYLKLRDLNSPDGTYPANSNFIELPTNVGIPNIKASETNITLYPNPFTTTITLTLQGSYHNPSLFIYNLLGQEAQHIYIGDKKEVTISREDLSEGMYFYRLTDSTGISVSGKLIVEDLK